MTDANETSVFLVGTVLPVPDDLDTCLKRAGIEYEHFPTAQSCRDALDARSCHVLVLDLDGHAVDGLQLLTNPEPRVAHIPKLVLVDHGDIPGAIAAIKQGAAGCLEKPIECERLSEEIEQLLSQVDRGLHAALSGLTRMEATVLRLILSGKTSSETAQTLHRSARTIEVHRSRIMRKLGASGVVDLVRIATSMGLFDATGVKEDYAE